MNKTLIIVLVLLVVLGGGYFLMGNKDVEAPLVDEGQGLGDTQLADSEGVGSQMPVPGTNTGEMVVGGDAVVPAVKEFTVDGANFSFVPSTMTVKKGDTVRITFVNKEGFHDLKIDEFNVATKQIKAGEQETIEFVADKSGSFEYYCTVGSHRAMGMKGTLMVTE